MPRPYKPRNRDKVHYKRNMRPVCEQMEEGRNRILHMTDYHGDVTCDRCLAKMIHYGLIPQASDSPESLVSAPDGI
jgi:hypothetical protein